MITQFSLSCKSATITPSTNRLVTVDITDPDNDELFEILDIKLIVAKFDAGALLDAIGENVAREHFDLHTADEVSDLQSKIDTLEAQESLKS